MISVCMGIYNGEAYIKEQLQSILDQTLQPDEVILCDDGSTDHTRDIVEQFIQERDLSGKWQLYCNHENKGYPDNFYYSMSLCRGDYVFLADQDDIWDRRKLERMTDVMKKNAGTKVLSCKFGLINEEGTEIHTLMKPTRTKRTGSTRNVSITDVFYKCEWPGMVMVYARQWYEGKLRRWREQEGQMGDNPQVPHDFLLCAWAAEEDSFCQLDEELAWHRRHDHNAGKEEHRLTRLLNPERKLGEIREYLNILGLFDSQSVMQTAQGYQALKHKQTVMKERFEALCSGKISKVLANIRRNHADTRFATAVCDMIIVFIASLRGIVYNR